MIAMQETARKLRKLVGIVLLGLGELALLGRLEAQPPPPKEESRTIRGVVQRFTTAPKGEVDGLILEDGTWVHWPPHLEQRFRDLVRVGDRIRVSGHLEFDRKGPNGPKGPKGPPRSGPKFEVETLTNLTTGKSANAFDDFGQPVAAARTIRGVVQRFTTAPKGEVNGLILEDGTWVHWPPHLEDRFAKVARKGDHIRARGRIETGPKGDTKFEVESLTNLTTGETATADGDPGPAAGRLGKEDRIRQLEAQIEQLRRELERLRRKE